MHHTGDSEMTDNIDQWRTEFCELQRSKRDTSFFDGRFLDDRTEILFHGFLIAKRAHKPVELPAISKDGFSPQYDCNEVHDALTAAGIQYTVKGI